MPGRSRLVSNLTALFGVQIATLVLPLVTLPFLTRVLQPAAWGQLAAVQALGLTLSLVVEYGFGYSGTRTVAAKGDQPEVIARTAAQILSAKLLLSLVVVLIGLLIFVLSPAFREHPLLFALGLVYAIAQGFTPLWYFQGIEDMRLVATTDVMMRCLSTALIFLLVRQPEQVWLVLAVQAGTIILGQGVNTARLYRSVSYIPPSFAAAASGLREGWSIFLFRGTVGLYTTANTALLRAFVPSAAVAQYANADRLATAAKSLVQPIMQVLFPRMSHLAHHDSAAAGRLARRSLLIMISLTSLVAACAYIVAPTLIPWFLGRAYQPSVPLFQLLCLTFPLIAISNILGIQWMLPNGMERAFNTIIVATGILNITLVFFLVPRFQTLGMVYVSMCSETFIVAAMFTYLEIGGYSPLRRGKKVGVVPAIAGKVSTDHD